MKGTVDPIRAHGAWVYLFASIGGGALLGSRGGVEPALLVGTGYAGAFLLVSALAVGPRRKLRQLGVGAALVVVAPLLALWAGAAPIFVTFSATAVVPAAGAVLLARRCGYLSSAALAVGIAAVVWAAPAVALAGRASAASATLLFVLLWLFFGWRSLRVAAPLRATTSWDRSDLRARGLREAGLAAVWTLVAVAGVQVGLG